MNFYKSTESLYICRYISTQLVTFTDTLKSIDTDILLYINGRHSPFWDTVMMDASNRFTWIPLYLLLAVIVIREYGKNSWLPIVFAILAVAMSDQFSVHFTKDVFMRYRPSHNLTLQNTLHIVNDYRGGLYGFVSSHAANTVSLTAFIVLLTMRKYIIVILSCWVFLVCYSRIYLGVHYPSDIIGGALLGSVTGWAVYRLYVFVKKRFLKDDAA